MERHGIDEHEAFELLRSHSRRSGRKLIEIAEAVAASHLLLRSPLTDSFDGSAPANRADGISRAGSTTDPSKDPNRTG
jgi:hypothetical protein